MAVVGDDAGYGGGDGVGGDIDYSGRRWCCWWLICVCN